MDILPPATLQNMWFVMKVIVMTLNGLIVYQNTDRYIMYIIKTQWGKIDSTNITITMELFEVWKFSRSWVHVQLDYFKTVDNVPRNFLCRNVDIEVDSCFVDGESNCS